MALWQGYLLDSTGQKGQIKCYIMPTSTKHSLINIGHLILRVNLWWRGYYSQFIDRNTDVKFALPRKCQGWDVEPDFLTQNLVLLTTLWHFLSMNIKYSSGFFEMRINLNLSFLIAHSRISFKD